MRVHLDKDKRAFVLVFDAPGEAVDVATAILLGLKTEGNKPFSVLTALAGCELLPYQKQAMAHEVLMAAQKTKEDQQPPSAAGGTQTVS